MSNNQLTQEERSILLLSILKIFPAMTICTINSFYTAFVILKIFQWFVTDTVWFLQGINYSTCLGIILIVSLLIPNKDAGKKLTKEETIERVRSFSLLKSFTSRLTVISFVLLIAYIWHLILA